MDRIIHIQRIDTPPDLRGDLAQPVWEKARWNGDFTVLTQPDKKAEHKTAFAMVHDGEKLYVAVKCEPVPGAQTNPSRTGQTAENPTGREQVQIMIDTEANGTAAGIFIYYSDDSAWKQKVITSTGGTRDWTGDVRHAVKTAGAGWSLQFVLGLAQFKHAPSSLGRWKVNVVRIPADAAPEQRSSFAPLALPAFWLPQNLNAVAQVEDPDAFLLFLWSMTPAGRARVLQAPSGCVCRQSVRLSNLLSTGRTVELRFSLKPDGAGVRQGQALHLQFEPDQTRTETIEVPTGPDFDFGQLEVVLIDPGTSRRLHQQRFVVESEPLSWKEHFIKRGDGKGGYSCQPAQLQFMARFRGRRTCPFGLAQMDNGEIILVGTLMPGGNALDQTLICFSSDGGAIWSDYQTLECGGAKQAPISSTIFRPMMLTYLGKGSLSVLRGDAGGSRLFSHDHGRTWTEAVPAQPAPDGCLLGVEGNSLVDRDAEGKAMRIAETGQTFSEGPYPRCPACEWIRWSSDGGRTWTNASRPEAWRWTETHNGKTYIRSGGEGALVRAANGWIVAALRLDMSPRYLDHPFWEDTFEGTGVSISKDDGKTWSPVERLFEGGRHHANLIRLASGDLVMTVIRRVDIRGGKLASYRRGCEAVISRDNGLTWEVEHRYVLNEFDFCEGDRWVNGECGHLYSTALNDGSILTGYGNNLAGGVLVKWRP